MQRILVFLCALSLTVLALSGCAQQQKGMGSAEYHPAESPHTATATAPPEAAHDPGTVLLTNDEIRQAVLTHAGLTSDQVTFGKCKLDWEDGTQIYEVEFYDMNGAKYDYEIDASTGAVIKYDYDVENHGSTPPASTSGMISEEQARDLALSQVPGSAASDLRQFKTDRDDGRVEYEGKIVYNGMEYEFEIDAYSGEIRSWEAEPVRH